MTRRAERLLSGLEEARRAETVAKIAFPEPAPCGKSPLRAEGLSKSYGSLEIFADVDLAVDRGSRVVVPGLNGAGKTTLLRLLAWRRRIRARSSPGTGCGSGTTRGNTRHSITTATVWQNCSMPHPLPALGNCAACSAPSCSPESRLTSRSGRFPAGENRLALAGLVSSAANVLLLDEPAINLDPASKEQALDALRRYTGAVVLATHDPGAVQALAPERVMLLPDGTENHWSDDYLDLVRLA